MNSGSRLTGKLFGFLNQSFYFYEPLWKFTAWDYYKPPDQRCSTTEGSCRYETCFISNLMIITFIWRPWPCVQIRWFRITCPLLLQVRIPLATLWILSCEEDIQPAYGTSVVLLKCPPVPEIMHEGAPEVFLHQ